MAYLVRYFTQRQLGQFNEKPCDLFHSPSDYPGLVCYHYEREQNSKQFKHRKGSCLAQKMILLGICV